MYAPYTLKWDQTFGNGMRNLFSKQLIKCTRILSTSKRASIGDFSSKTSAAKAIAKKQQLYPSVWSNRRVKSVPAGHVEISSRHLENKGLN